MLTARTPAASHVTSVLRWMGSKRRSASEIVAQFPDPDHVRTYYEPFLGGGSVFFAYGPSRSVLSDLNSELINAWRHVRDQPERVHAEVTRLLPEAATYYEIRAQAPAELPVLDQAVRFVYLNRYCFNGIYRTNRSEQFNVPFGSNTGSLPAADAFAACADLLRTASLRNVDFAEALVDAGDGDLVYLDPPWLSERATYGEYGYAKHAAATEARITEVATEVSRRGALVFISLPDRHANIVGALKRTNLKVHYNVASNASRRRRSNEVLIRVATTSAMGVAP